MITLTQEAIRQVKHLIHKKGGPNLALRIGVKGGGCSGLSYVMTLTDTSNPSDLSHESGGIRILVDPKSARFIEGTTLDFNIKNLLEGGWVFHNPNASRSCGCGTSFTPKSNQSEPSDPSDMSDESEVSK